MALGHASLSGPGSPKAKGTLKCTIIEGKDLRSTGTSDNFVLVRAKNGEGSDILTWKTKVLKKCSKNPVWKEELVALIDTMPPLTLSFEVWDRKNNDFLGQGVHNLDPDGIEGPIEQIVQLKDRPGKKDKAKGTLKVVLDFKSKTSIRTSNKRSRLSPKPNSLLGMKMGSKEVANEGPTTEQIRRVFDMFKKPTGKLDLSGLMRCICDDVDKSSNLRQATLSLLMVDADKDEEITWDEFQELFRLFTTEEFARKCICAAYDENSGIGVITKDSFIERMEMSLPIHKFSEVTKIYTVRIENKVYPPSRSTIDLWKRCFDDLDTAKTGSIDFYTFILNSGAKEFLKDLHCFLPINAAEIDEHELCRLREENMNLKWQLHRLRLEMCEMSKRVNEVEKELKSKIEQECGSLRQRLEENMGELVKDTEDSDEREEEEENTSVHRHRNKRDEENEKISKEEEVVVARPRNSPAKRI